MSSDKLLGMWYQYYISEDNWCWKFKAGPCEWAEFDKAGKIVIHSYHKLHQGVTDGETRPSGPDPETEVFEE